MDGRGCGAWRAHEPAWVRQLPSWRRYGCRRDTLARRDVLGALGTQRLVRRLAEFLGRLPGRRSAAGDHAANAQSSRPDGRQLTGSAREPRAWPVNGAAGRSELALAQPRQLLGPAG